jgi:hypothetical protein
MNHEVALECGKRDGSSNPLLDTQPLDNTVAIMAFSTHSTLGRYRVRAKTDWPNVRRKDR